tara:strand:+ start:97 stop:1002 length:906 start_codon:yes stop_codon:yes gene_type:complete
MTEAKSDDAKHAFLRIGRYHLNERAAEKYVLAALAGRFPTLTKNRIRAGTFTFGSGPKAFSKEFRELTREARATGAIRSVQRFIAPADPYFAPTIGLATDTSGLGFKSSLAGKSAAAQGPMRLYAVEDELLEDILYYRQAACDESSLPFELCTRHIRAYILSCTAMVEAFLNRPVLVESTAGSNSALVASLLQPMNVENRFETWVAAFCPTSASFSGVKQTVHWAHFQELRAKRNAIVHSAEPLQATEIEKMPHVLNLVREGVGGLLLQLRSMQGLGSLGFIDRLASAPRVSFLKKPSGKT